MLTLILPDFYPHDNIGEIAIWGKAERVERLFLFAVERVEDGQMDVL